MERVIAYVDGFNLYHGLKQNNLRRFYWLNVKKLIESILLPNQQLVRVNYFTSRITHPPTKIKRQNAYLEALETLSDFKIVFGHYVASKQTCRSYRAENTSPREKRTDVNIATKMLSDAFRDKFDSLIVVSGDTDLIGPLTVIRDLFPAKKRIVAFPPGRYSDHMKNFATGYLHIGEDKFLHSLFPNTVASKTGYPLTKPACWP